MSSTGGPCRRACSATADRGAEQASPGMLGRPAPAGRLWTPPTSARRERWPIEILTLDAGATASGSSGALPNAAPPGCARGAGRVHARPAVACASRAARRGTGQAVPATRSCASSASRAATRIARGHTNASAPAGRRPSSAPPVCVPAVGRHPPPPSARPARAAPQRDAKPSVSGTRRPGPTANRTEGATLAPSAGAPAPPAGSASTNVAVPAGAHGAAAGRPSRAARPASPAARSVARPSASSTTPGEPMGYVSGAAVRRRTAVPCARPAR